MYVLPHFGIYFQIPPNCKTVIKIFVSGSQLMFHISDVCNSETPVLEFVDLVKTNPGYQLAQPTECTFCLVLVFIFRFPNCKDQPGDLGPSSQERYIFHFSKIIWQKLTTTAHLRSWVGFIVK